MNTSYNLDIYKAHDLNIIMHTSSGDTIKMDFANHQTASLSQTQNKNLSKSSMSFSSMQSFSFSIQSNGIDEQDQKEINEFMKIAQPKIDNFLADLKEDAPKTPVTKLAHEIAGIFNPNKDRDENNINNVKNNIVKTFDKSIENLKLQDSTENLSKIDNIFESVKNLLEKTLQEFDYYYSKLYA